MKKQETTFYQKIQESKDLDLRSNIGKVHKLAFVLLGLVIALLRNRDGNMSSIHRSMQNKNEELCLALGIDIQVVVSRSHLPILLKKVNRSAFERLLFEFYGIGLNSEQKKWFAGDGKELKGSIELGDKRGDVVVQLVEQDTKESVGQSFYDGTKASEKPALRELIEDAGVANQKITADALHLNPKTTELIHQAEGIYIIGLKGNQKNLLQHMKACIEDSEPVNQALRVEKDHGRVERRTYFQYDIEEEQVDERWENSGFKSLFSVTRERYNTKTKKESIKTDLYISNGGVEKKEDYFGAIRGHWSVEVNNHLRDVTLDEDQLTTTIKPLGRLMASCRTLIIKILQKLKPKNYAALLDLFQDDFSCLIRQLRNVNFL